MLGSAVLRQGVAIAALAVTARLLAPADFGIAAYVVIATMLLELLQRQITLPLVRLDVVERAHLDTLFTFQLVLALGAGLVVWGFAGPIAAMLGVPALREVLPFVALTAFLVASRSPRFQLFEREFSFSPAAGETVVSQGAYAVVVIGLAWMWRDYWALVAATLVQTGVRGVFTYVTAPMLPRLSLARWRDTLSFSGWAAAAQVCSFGARRTPLLMIAGTLGVADAGIFRVGERIVTLVTAGVASPIARVVYPGLADVARDTGGEATAFMRLNGMLLSVMLPLGVGMALVADEAVRIGAGAQWIAAGQVVWVLAPLRALEALQMNTRSAAYVSNHMRALFVRNAVLFGATALALWVGVRFGLAGALAAAALAGLMGIVATLLLAYRLGAGRFFAPLLVAWRSFAACAVMAAAVLAVDAALVSTPGQVGLVRTAAIKVLVGIGVYMVAHAGLWRLAGYPDGIEARLREILAAASYRDTR